MAEQTVTEARAAISYAPSNFGPKEKLHRASCLIGTVRTAIEEEGDGGMYGEVLRAAEEMVMEVMEAEFEFVTVLRARENGNG